MGTIYFLLVPMRTVYIFSSMYGYGICFTSMFGYSQLLSMGINHKMRGLGDKLDL